MFNLNDPRWGRGDNNNEDGSKPDSSAPEGERPPMPPAPEQRPRPSSPQQGQPPDLEEVWRDLNRKLSGLFGGGSGNGRGVPPAAAAVSLASLSTPAKEFS
jgi:membrane protease subunit HflK